MIVLLKSLSSFSEYKQKQKFEFMQMNQELY